MPEGDTVFQTARLLERSLSGQRLTRSDLRVPQHATADLAGQTVTGTISRGKHLLTRTDAGITLHTHLKMEGAWHVYAAGQRWRRLADQARVVLSTERTVAVGFTLGIVELLPTAEEDRVVGHLGPDLLGPDWDPDEAVRRLLTAPDRPVMEALLDQRNLAGIGNIYGAELCFTSGVHPATPIGAVPRLPRLVRRAHQMLELNKERPPRTTTGNRRTGEQTWVYGRLHQQCRRCGTPIERTHHGVAGQERIVDFCPSCQPLP
ncbi:DNA-formamidopyrimidine glycosylase family protein [Nocardioides sp.]|uniref:DNA-formamidopyrimidine glycosylase family protein n=1 Tax=Nocardioides sp. TaxID=35761 RepID=UPI002614422E|nr:DNA-formamidopyrimidine glycosylase family protein [Nocardioides sp.]